jgi:hypothetical protein
LVLVLAFFRGSCTGARGIGFSFLLGCVALGVRVVLLRLAFSDYDVPTYQRATNLVGLTLDALNDAFDRFLWSALLIPHSLGL